MVTLKQFLSDTQGRRFIDVVKDKRLDFSKVIDFFNDRKRIDRMINAEEHHQRPPLAGVIIELESLSYVERFFTRNPLNTTARFRQAVGLLVKLHMLKLGWKPAGKKGSLCMKRQVKSKDQGTYTIKHGLAQWFNKAERYEKNDE